MASCTKPVRRCVSPDGSDKTGVKKNCSCAFASDVKRLEIDIAFVPYTEIKGGFPFGLVTQRGLNNTRIGQAGATRNAEHGPRMIGAQMSRPRRGHRDWVANPNSSRTK